MEILGLLLSGLPVTLRITAGALLIGVVAAVPLTVLRRCPVRLVRGPAIFVIALVRAVPPIVWIFVVYYTVGSLDQFRLEAEPAATIGLGLIASAYIAEIYRGAIEAIPAGQFDAIHALAIPGPVAYARVVAPQSLVLVIAPVTSYAVSLLKDSALASVVGAQDVTFLAFEHSQLSMSGLETFIVAGALYLILSLLISWAGAGLERIGRWQVAGV